MGVAAFSLQPMDANVAELANEARAKQGAVTSRMLRTFPLGRFERAVKDGARRYANLENASSTHAAFARDAITILRPGRRGRNPVEYARIAQQYVACLGDAAPIAVLARSTGLDIAQVRNLVHEARRRGFLTSTKPGVADGALTEEGRRLLDGVD
jgi:hypothetical protein